MLHQPLIKKKTKKLMVVKNILTQRIWRCMLNKRKNKNKHFSPKKKHESSALQFEKLVLKASVFVGCILGWQFL
jgi:hypothetical protein